MEKLNLADCVNIRPAGYDDRDRVRGIAIRAWDPIFRSWQDVMGDELFERMFGGWQEMKASEVQDVLVNYPQNILVTECEGEVIGFITFRCDSEKKVGEIGNNAVDPDFQNRGLGTKQYEKILDIFREKGMDYAQVCTGLDEPHAPARTAYQKVGFKQMIPTARYFRKL